MSTDRRTFLAGAAALPTFTFPAVAGETDPVFALLAAEQDAHGVYGRACEAFGETEAALWASEWDRSARVLVGYSVDLDGTEAGQAPAELPRVPLYLHSHEEIRAEFDARRARAHRRQRGRSTADMIAEMQALMRRQTEAEAALEADMRAIKAAPEVVRHNEADLASGRASRAHLAALLALAETVPSTPAGFRAFVERMTERDDEDELDAETMRAALWTVWRYVKGGEG